LQQYVHFVEDKTYLNLGDKYGEIEGLVTKPEPHEVVPSEVREEMTENPIAMEVAYGTE
jgi:hypothetical protein